MPLLCTDRKSKVKIFGQGTRNYKKQHTFFLSKNKFRAVKTVKENIKIVIITVSLLFEKVKKIVNMLKNDIKE